MAVRPSGRGPQQPDKYPIAVGDKYLYWGEQEGWDYDPYTDSYKRPENKPSSPGLGEQLATVGGAAAVTAGAGQAGKEIVEGLTEEGSKEVVDASVDASVDAIKESAGTEVLDQAQQAGADAAAEAAANGASLDEQAQAASDAAANSMHESGVSVSDITTAAAWIYEAYKAYGTITDDNLTDEQKGQAVAKQVALAVADYWTFGLASLAYWAASTSSEFREAEGKFAETDPTVKAAGATGKVLGGSAKTEDYANMIFSGDPIGGTILNHMGLGFNDVLGSGMSTNETQQQRWGEEVGQIKQEYKDMTPEERRAIDEEVERTGNLGLKYENPQALHFWGSQNDVVLDGGKDGGVWTEETDPTGRFVGKKWNIEDALEIAKEYPDTFMLNYANFQAASAATGGNADAWYDLTDEQRQEFIRRAIDEGLYSSDKGSILFSEKKGHLDRAQELFAEISGGVEGGVNPNVLPEEGQVGDGQPSMMDTSGGANDQGRFPDQEQPPEGDQQPQQNPGLMDTSNGTNDQGRFPDGEQEPQTRNASDAAADAASNILQQSPSSGNPGLMNPDAWSHEQSLNEQFNVLKDQGQPQMQPQSQYMTYEEILAGIQQGRINPNDPGFQVTQEQLDQMRNRDPNDPNIQKVQPRGMM